MNRVAGLINPCYPAEMIGRLERGDLSFHEACDAMRKLDGRYDVTDAQIAGAYGAFLAGVPVWKLRQVERLRGAGIRTYVLSNNNPASMEVIPANSRPTGTRWTTISTRYTSPTNCAS